MSWSYNNQAWDRERGVRRDGDKAKEDAISQELAVSTITQKWAEGCMEFWKGDGRKVQSKKESVDSFTFWSWTGLRGAGDYGKVAEIRYGKTIQLEKKLPDWKTQIEKKRSKGSLIREEVRSEDIAEIVSKWTGIPVSKMLESEKEKLLRLEDELHKRVVGQEWSHSCCFGCSTQVKSRLQDQKKPVGSFIFIGTTGVGKTELARALAEFLFNDENLLTRIDMSEYQERIR